MVVLLDLDDLEDEQGFDGRGRPAETYPYPVETPRYLARYDGDAGEEELPDLETRLNLNINGFSSALGCYPYVYYRLPLKITVALGFGSTVYLYVVVTDRIANVDHLA